MKAKCIAFVVVTLVLALATGCNSASGQPGANPDATAEASAAQEEPVATVEASTAPQEPRVTVLATGLEGASGSAVGPDQALYVTEGALGQVTRVDPATGAKSIFAEGLPTWVSNIGGAIDIAFLDGTAYVLVTQTDDIVLGRREGPSGIYRLDGPDDSTLIANIGAYAKANPPVPHFFLPTGVQFALETYDGGFLVTDGHHNRVYHVSLDGTISELITFDNIVPTGLETLGDTILMAEAGPVPHEPQNGKIVSFAPDGSSLDEVATGARLLVDVEHDEKETLYGLAQGVFPNDGSDGDPAEPNTGSLVRVNGDGGFDTLVEELNQPTSLEFIGNDAYVVTHAGDIYKITGVAGPPFGRP